MGLPAPVDAQEGHHDDAIDYQDDAKDELKKQLNQEEGDFHPGLCRQANLFCGRKDGKHF